MLKFSCLRYIYIYIYIYLSFVIIDVLVHLLTNRSSINLTLEPLLNDCINLIRAFPNYTMTHIFRETNRCADRLVKIEVIQLIDFLILY